MLLLLAAGTILWVKELFEASGAELSHDEALGSHCEYAATTDTNCLVVPSGCNRFCIGEQCRKASPMDTEDIGVVQLTEDSKLHLKVSQLNNRRRKTAGSRAGDGGGASGAI